MFAVFFLFFFFFFFFFAWAEFYCEAGVFYSGPSECDVRFWVFFFVITPAAIYNWSSWKLSPWRGSCGSNPDHQPTRLWQVNPHDLLVREERKHVCWTGVWLFIIPTPCSSNNVGTNQHCQGLEAYSGVPLELTPLGPLLYVWNTEASIIGATLSEPHTTSTAWCTHCVCMFVAT